MKYSFLQTLLLALVITLVVPAKSGLANTTARVATLQESSDLFVEIIEQTKPGVVYIELTKESAQGTRTDSPGGTFFYDTDIQDFFNSNDPEPAPPRKKNNTPTVGHGSGFIISPDGYIITNSHVVKDAQSIRVTLADRRQFKARLIGSDSRSDIGVIKIDAKELKSLPLGVSGPLRAGEWVLAFGSPFENIQTVTSGIISATGRNSLGISDYEDFLQTDAAINPGNSGGPLVNIHGEVIGVNTAFITRDGGYMGIGFAVPIDMAHSVANQILTAGKVVRGWLGVALKDSEPEQLQKQNLPLSTRAARIVGIQEKSPAAGADLLEEDLIVSINDVAVHGAADLRNRIALLPPKTEVFITFYRNSTRYTSVVTLGTLQ